MAADTTLPRDPGKLVGRRIAAARRSRFLTQEALAQRLGWPKDTLINYEHGRRAISVDKLFSIAQALDLPPAILLIEDEELARVLAQIITDRKLQEQVAFFLQTMADEQPVPPPPTPHGTKRDRSPF